MLDKVGELAVAERLARAGISDPSELLSKATSAIAYSRVERVVSRHLIQNLSFIRPQWRYYVENVTLVSKPLAGKVR